MHKFLIIFMLSLVIISKANLAASQTDNQKKLYVELSFLGGAESHDYIAVFLDEFSLATQPYDIEIIYVEEDTLADYPYFWEQNAIHLIFNHQPSFTLVSVTPYINMELSASPALQSVSSLPTSTILDADKESHQSALTLSLGIALYASHDCESAMPFLLAASENEDIHPILKDTFAFYVANCHIVAGDLESARVLLEQHLTNDPDEIYYYSSFITNIAWIQLQSGHTQEAFDHMDDLIATTLAKEGWSYHQVSIIRQKAALAISIADYATAIQSINYAIQIASEDLEFLPSSWAELYTERGQMYRAIYEWDNALADFNTALELTPDYAEAYYQRGLLYYSILQTGTETRDEALADFQHYLKIAPEGRFSVEAARYAESIQAELDALGG